MSHTIAGILLPDALEAADSGPVKDITVLDAIATAIGNLQGAQSGDAAFVTNVSGTFIGHKGLDGSTITSGSNPGTIINDAINYVNGLPNGGTVALPYGNINLTTQNIVGKPGVRLRGQGMIQQQRAGDGYGTTIIGPAGTDLTYLIDGLDAWGFFVQDLNLNANNKTANCIRLAAYRSTMLNVQAANATTRNVWVTAGAAASPADAYVNMQLYNVYVDGYGVSTAKGIVVDGSLGSLVCSDGRMVGIDVFSCGNDGLDIRKSDWEVHSAHITANSGVTPTDAGVNIQSTGFLGNGIVVDSIGHGHFFKINAAGVRLNGCWAVYGGGTENTFDAVNIAGGAAVTIRDFFVQITTATNVPRYVINQNGDPTGKGRIVDGVMLIGTGTGVPALGMTDQPDEKDGYWIRGVYAHA